MNVNDQSAASLYEQLNLTKPPERNVKNDRLGQDEFLSLMTTQLQNQDPFKPLENGDFIAQMAQFGTVSGIEDLQKSFESLSSSLTSNRALEASVMVGRSVPVPSGHNNLVAGEAMKGAIDLPNAAGDVTLKITNDQGELVATRKLGPQSGGLVNFDWDGIDNAGETAAAGKYTVTAEALIGGKTVQVNTLASGNVDSVSLGSGPSDFTLHVAGIGDVKLGDVREINA